MFYSFFSSLLNVRYRGIYYTNSMISTLSSTLPHLPSSKHLASNLPTQFPSKNEEKEKETRDSRMIEFIIHIDNIFLRISLTLI